MQAGAGLDQLAHQPRSWAGILELVPAGADGHVEASEKKVGTCRDWDLHCSSNLAPFQPDDLQRLGTFHIDSMNFAGIRAANEPGRALLS